MNLFPLVTSAIACLLGPEMTSVYINIQVSVEVENILELSVQSNAQNKRKLCSRIELPGLYGADGVSGDAYHLRELPLRETLLRPNLLDLVS